MQYLVHHMPLQDLYEVPQCSIDTWNGVSQLYVEVRSNFLLETHF